MQNIIDKFLRPFGINNNGQISIYFNVRDWCWNSHTEERLWGIQREKYKQTLKWKPFAFDKSLGNLSVIYGFSHFFPCQQWTSTVPWQFAPMKAREDWISITVYFLWSPLIVRTRRFSVSELKKKFKRLFDPGICSLHFKETDIAITFLSIKIFLQAAIRLSLTPKLIDRGYPETLITSTHSVIKFEDRKLALQQRCKEDIFFCHTIPFDSARSKTNTHAKVAFNPTTTTT